MQAPERVLQHLRSLGIEADEVFYQLTPAELYEQALSRGEAQLAAGGALVVNTAPSTGRRPKDRFIVKDETHGPNIGWGDVNLPIAPEAYQALKGEVQQYASGKPLFVRDGFAGSDPRYRMPVRFISEKAWHNLFNYNMFLRPNAAELEDFEPHMTVVDMGEYETANHQDVLNSGAFVLVNLEEGVVLIAGTRYGGEQKKSIFSALNYVLPAQNVFPMHCSANQGKNGDTAVFFGLSGTGKTTLSADPERTLIGDDEHGWSADGVFNFEGGCYAKVIRLNADAEPEIHATTERFGTILENVLLNDQRCPDLDDASITENTRASYPIDYIPNASDKGMGGHPQNVVFLTADAYGVLPPISKLTPEQAMYHFLSGYTAKVAGTEKGVTEPKATFSACFGEPFMVRKPSEYAEMLGEKIREHDAKCWLVNTGWTAGPYGTGHRMQIKHTRAMLNAALRGDLDDVPTTTDPVFGLAIPSEVPGVPSDLLTPRNTWADKDAYDRQAQKLAEMFQNNFAKYADNVSDDVRAAGPTVNEEAAS